MEKYLTNLFNGKKLYVFKHRESVSMEPKKFGCLEPNITNVILNILSKKNNNIFIDLGANFGYYSILASEYCEKVISIEPLNICTELINSSILENKIDNIFIEEVCVSNIEKDIYLNVKDGNIGSTRLIETKTDYKSKTLKLESILLKYKIKDIDLIKIDIEGQEPNVINSSLDIFKNVKYIILEVSPAMKDYENKTKAYFNYIKTLKNLSNIGFKLCEIEGNFFGKYNHQEDFLEKVIDENNIDDIENYLLGKKQINVLCYK